MSLDIYFNENLESLLEDLEEITQKKDFNKGCLTPDSLFKLNIGGNNQGFLVGRNYFNFKDEEGEIKKSLTLPFDSMIYTSPISFKNYQLASFSKFMESPDFYSNLSRLTIISNQKSIRGSNTLRKKVKHTPISVLLTRVSQIQDYKLLE